MAKPITDPFVLHACELLGVLGPVVVKRMFGGYGLSVDGMNVAIIAWDTLFLKTNAETEPRWLAAGGAGVEHRCGGRAVEHRRGGQPPDLCRGSGGCQSDPDAV